jgi:hypothetical protein
MRDLICFDSSAFVGEDSDLCISDKHIMNGFGLKFSRINGSSEKRLWNKFLFWFRHVKLKIFLFNHLRHTKAIYA